jgi:hypothetical protein
VGYGLPGEGRDRQGRFGARQGPAQAELGKLEAAAGRSSPPAIRPRRKLLPALERVDTLSARLATRGAEIDTELTRIEGVVSGLGTAAPARLADRIAALKTEGIGPAQGRTLDALGHRSTTSTPGSPRSPPNPTRQE